jgi:hypothetical protein
VLHEKHGYQTDNPLNHITGFATGLDADLWDGKHMPANAAGNLHNDGAGNLSWV